MNSAKHDFFSLMKTTVFVYSTTFPIYILNFNANTITKK